MATRCSDTPPANGAPTCQPLPSNLIAAAAVPRMNFAQPPAPSFAMSNASTPPVGDCVGGMRVGPGPGQVPPPLLGHSHPNANMVFVFPTSLANQAAEKVRAGECKSIIDYHKSQNSTLLVLSRPAISAAASFNSGLGSRPLRSGGPGSMSGQGPPNKPFPMVASPLTPTSLPAPFNVTAQGSTHPTCLPQGISKPTTPRSMQGIPGSVASPKPIPSPHSVSAIKAEPSSSPMTPKTPHSPAVHSVSAPLPLGSGDPLGQQTMGMVPSGRPSYSHGPLLNQCSAGAANDNMNLPINASASNVQCADPLRKIVEMTEDPNLYAPPAKQPKMTSPISRRSPELTADQLRARAEKLKVLQNMELALLGPRDNKDDPYGPGPGPAPMSAPPYYVGPRPFTGQSMHVPHYMPGGPMPNAMMQPPGRMGMPVGPRGGIPVDPQPSNVDAERWHDLVREHDMRKAFPPGAVQMRGPSTMMMGNRPMVPGMMGQDGGIMPPGPAHFPPGQPAGAPPAGMIPQPTRPAKKSKSKRAASLANTTPYPVEPMPSQPPMRGMHPRFMAQFPRGMAVPSDMPLPPPDGHGMFMGGQMPMRGAMSMPVNEPMPPHMSMPHVARFGPSPSSLGPAIMHGGASNSILDGGAFEAGSFGPGDLGEFGFDPMQAADFGPEFHPFLTDPSPPHGVGGPRFGAKVPPGMHGGRMMAPNQVEMDLHPAMQQTQQHPRFPNAPRHPTVNNTYVNANMTIQQVNIQNVNHPPFNMPMNTGAQVSMNLQQMNMQNMQQQQHMFPPDGSQFSGGPSPAHPMHQASEASFGRAPQGNSANFAQPITDLESKVPSQKFGYYPDRAGPELRGVPGQQQGPAGGSRAPSAGGRGSPMPGMGVTMIQQNQMICSATGDYVHNNFHGGNAFPQNVAGNGGDFGGSSDELFLQQQTVAMRQQRNMDAAAQGDGGYVHFQNYQNFQQQLYTTSAGLPRRMPPENGAGNAGGLPGIYADVYQPQPAK